MNWIKKNWIPIAFVVLIIVLVADKSRDEADQILISIKPFKE